MPYKEEYLVQQAKPNFWFSKQRRKLSVSFASLEADG